MNNLRLNNEIYVIHIISHGRALQILGVITEYSEGYL